ncbi:contractile injection system protein, VgrG/Pvc8 family, partial [Gilliamella sp. Pas-s27]|uniref:contractile injection system protein, VgrG/Pvc8 family n=1 Tax=Gilliamella sp. Pas-s27 TaxID=2687311 RepID=UPI00139FE761
GANASGSHDNGRESETNTNDSDNNSSEMRIESGEWYARLRHEQKISQQVIIHGKSNRYALAPGQWINIKGSPLNNINDG